MNVDVISIGGIVNQVKIKPRRFNEARYKGSIFVLIQEVFYKFIEPVSEGNQNGV